MDKALYVAMTGARATLQAQGTVSHNLANADTAGFKAALANTEAFRIQGGTHTGQHRDLRRSIAGRLAPHIETCLYAIDVDGLAVKTHVQLRGERGEARLVVERDATLQASERENTALGSRFMCTATSGSLTCAAGEVQ